MTNEERAGELADKIREAYNPTSGTINDYGVWESTRQRVLAALDAAEERERKRCAGIARRQVPPPAIENPATENNQCQAHGFNIAAAIEAAAAIRARFGEE